MLYQYLNEKHKITNAIIGFIFKKKCHWGWYQLQNGISGKGEREKEGIADKLIVLVTLFKKISITIGNHITSCETYKVSRWENVSSFKFLKLFQ